MPLYNECVSLGLKLEIISSLCSRVSYIFYLLHQGLDDLEGDDSPYNGSHTHGDFGRQETVRSPSQLPPLQEEPSSPSYEGSKLDFVYFKQSRYVLQS